MTVHTTDWTKDAEALLPDLVALRRAIHAEPELGLSLPKTTAKVKAALAGLPLDYREGGSTTGLVAVLKGAESGPTVLRGYRPGVRIRDSGRDACLWA